MFDCVRVVDAAKHARYRPAISNLACEGAFTLSSRRHKLSQIATTDSQADAR